MSLKDPQDILKGLDVNIDKVRSNAPLSSDERRQIADDLSEVFNYLSASCRRPSLTNALYVATAHDARQKKQFEQERAVLYEHREFVEQSFDKADQYLKTIQLGGYAAFFAVWGVTREWLNPAWAALAAILMIVSATTFVIWEVFRSTILALALKRHSLISSAGLENFLQSRMAILIKEQSTVLSLAKSRATVWLLCVCTAGISLTLLLWQLLCVFSRELSQ